MKIIVASSDNEISNTIADQFTASGIQANLSVVEVTDDFIEELRSDNFDFIITDYSFDGIDIWQLSKVINSTQLAAHALPLYLIKETCDTEIPLILAKEYLFQITPLMELPHTLQAAYQHNHNTGYLRGPVPTDKPNILVIEDDEDAAEFVYLALKDSYDIDRTIDGEQGLALWTKKRHDLVLLDYMLPVIKGDEVLARIMAVDKNQPVVIMTAYDRPEYNKNFLLNGASQYLPKPFTLADLRTQCATIINKAKLIYQSHYTDMKINNLTNLVYELDHYLNNNNFEKARRVMASIKVILPNNLTEDDQLKWPYSEF
jgi:DNA-binding response OmpR family regulator